MCGLRVRFRQSPAVRGVFGFALRVEVTGSKDIPQKIFVYHQSSPGIDGNSRAEFSHVATPVDFQEIPEDAASETVPWYRSKVCTVWTRSVSDLELAKQMLMDDIHALQRSYDILKSEDNFVNQTDIDFTGEMPHYPLEPSDIDLIEAQIMDLYERKLDKDAMSDMELSVRTVGGMRDSIVAVARTLGARIEGL